MRLRRRTGLILAMDVTDEGRAVQVARQAAEHLDAVKVNYPLVLGAGPQIIGRLADASGVPVIADFKVADVPHTNYAIARRAFELGACGIICQPFCGPDSADACARAAREAGADLYLVVAMSHPGAKRFFTPRLDEFASLAREVGAQGVVAPATRTEEIRRVRELLPRTAILAPGVGAQGGDARAAREAGADFLIVGRAVYEAADPARAARALAVEAGRGTTGR